MMIKLIFSYLILFCLLSTAIAEKRVAYIHGDIAQDGSIPSGSLPTYDQMLLTDTGNTGCSQFKSMVENEGYSISQHYDQTTTLNTTFLDQFDVIIFGLHQKIWSEAEKTTLDQWIREGGGILMYSDSAAGGKYDVVGIGNPTGQNAVNNILSPYGMQVSVDQGGGIRAYTSPTNSTNPIIWDNPNFEGEGVSPVAIDPSGNSIALIPFDDTHKISGSSLTPGMSGITITNPQWACMAHCKVGAGNIIAIFDRQPMWNNGPGSDINEENNKEILRRTVRFLANDYGNSSEWLNMTHEGLILSFRQWTGGVGTPGYNYVARNTRFSLLQKTNLTHQTWYTSSDNIIPVSTTIEPDGETERVTVHLIPDDQTGFIKAASTPSFGLGPITVEAGMNLYISEAGKAKLEASSTGSSFKWEKVSGPGDIAFSNSEALHTTAEFSTYGIYELSLTASNETDSATDHVTINVLSISTPIVAINCGGDAFSAQNGINYEADNYYAGGNIDNFPGNAVKNTNDDALYNTARSKHSAYNIPLSNGNYTVYLQFAETYWTGINQRIFTTSMEGSPVIQNLDLYKTAPGKWTAYDLAFPVTITDGTLNMSFSASINNSLLNAFMIIQN